ncbi:hypothetical protein ACFCX4_34180 [Kitasatospora sp. NPDC056327]|uniref:hypothetical protein n=1 Tax=Kitasatospora sp. NPDC056327 TaxID=3345785 RepID=UPI0035E30F4C
MTDQQNTAPAVWDPTARGGAGGWVRGPQQSTAPAAPPAVPAPQQPPRSPAGPPGPPADDAPTAVIPQPVPPRPAAPGSLPPRDGTPPPAAPTAPAFPQAAPAGPPYGAPHGSPQQPPPPQPEYGRPYGQNPPYDPAPAYDPAPYDPAPYDRVSYDQASYDQPGHSRPAYGQPPYGPPAPQQQQYDYPQHDYPTGYGQHDDDEDRPGNRRAPLLIAFALLFVLALGGGILWAVRDKGGSTDQAGPASPSASVTGGTAASGNPPPAPAPTGSAGAPTPAASDTAAASPTPSASATAGGPNAQTQAKALDELLGQGENAKAPIGNAVAKVNSCPAKSEIDSSAQVFDNGAKQRDQLLTKLATLSVTDLPGGAEAVQSLRSAWQLSADIDRAYAAWARTVATQGCSGAAPNTADKKRADELNPQATQAKKDFVAKWKTIADQFGLTPRTQDRI